MARTVAVVAALLILPVLALHRRGTPLQWVAAYGVAVSAITYWAYADDKRRAREGEWRIAEARLHLGELLGGWPGAWIAQQFLRHKSAKLSYQLVFWLIVFAYQFAALDSLRDWQFSRAGVQWVQQLSSR